ncbi:bacteriocin biosynthesis cyclodehydratase domain-containing protein [Marmoricola sp. OAE513]|uniref:TOMM precursor leader peptide-binding protein n=1 Tax=Marmoricola sp. OAE513 TaxID=2817894 RepID=UPI001AE9C961
MTETVTPGRPVLAPGLHPLEDPSGQVQFGLEPPHRHRVPNTPAVRRVLEILGRGEALPDVPEIRTARRLLAPVLRDGDTLVRPGVDPAEVAAVTLRHPLSAAARLAARQDARIEVRGSLGPDVAALVAAVGLGRTDDKAGSASATPPSAVLLLSRGEADRDELDVLSARAIPHLLVRAVESEIVVGPFVVPGTTSCVRCLDLHRTTAEPSYGSLLGARLRADRHDGVVEPVDAALAWVALGWAVTDLVRYAEGERPSTWSATVRLDGSPGPVGTEHQRPHPDCSCTWTAMSGGWDGSVTMEV